MLSLDQIDILRFQKPASLTSSSAILICCLRTKQPSLDSSGCPPIPPCLKQLNFSKKLSAHNSHFFTCHPLFDSWQPGFCHHKAKETCRHIQEILLSLPFLDLSGSLHTGDPSLSPKHLSCFLVFSHPWFSPASQTSSSYFRRFFSRLRYRLANLIAPCGFVLKKKTTKKNNNNSGQCFSNFNRHMNLLEILIKAVSDTVES